MKTGWTDRYRPRSTQILWGVAIVAWSALVAWTWRLTTAFFFWDEWDFLTDMAEGSYELFTPHNEHLIPLYKLQYLVQFKLFGLDAMSFHYTIIGLHLLASYTLFALLRMLTSSTLPSALGASYFAFHSFHAENLFWGFQGQILMSCITGMLVLFLFELYIRRRTPLVYAVALGILVTQAYFFGTGLVFPIVAAAYLVLRDRAKPSIWELGGIFSVLVWNMSVYKVLASSKVDINTGGIGFRDIPLVMDAYTQSLFHNFGRALTGEYPMLLDAAFPSFTFSAFAIALAAATTVWAWRVENALGRVMVFAWIYYAVIFVPISAGRFRFGYEQSFAGRYAYLYLIPMTIGATVGFTFLARRIRTQRLRYFAAAALTCWTMGFVILAVPKDRENADARAAFFDSAQTMMTAYVNDESQVVDTSGLHSATTSGEMRNAYIELTRGCEATLGCRIRKWY